MAENLADLIVKISADFGSTDSQITKLADSFTKMGDSAVKVGVAVDENLDARLQALMNTGESLSEALADLAGKTTDVGDTSATAAEQLDLFDESLDIPYADAAGQLELFTTELEPIPDLVTETADGLDEAGESADDAADELEDFAEAAGEGAESASELLLTLLEFGGIVVSMEALKEAALETFKVFAEEQRATEALTALRGSSEEAEHTIAHLKQTALTLAVPFDQLLQVNQRMAAFGFSAKASEAALVAAADAARATNRDIGSVADTMNRLALSGQASSRFLATLGLSLGDLSKALGVTQDEVQATFRALAQSDPTRSLEVLTAALSKYQGLAASTAGDLTGIWENFKTKLDYIFEEIGKELAPAAEAFTSFATEEVASVGEMILSVVRFGEELVKLPNWIKDIGIALVAAFTSPAGVAAIAALQLTVAWEQADRAQEGLGRTIKEQSKAFDVLTVTMERQFDQFPNFAARFRELQSEYKNGQISQEAFEKSLHELDVEFKVAHPVVVAAGEAHQKTAAQIEKEAEATAKLKEETKKYEEEQEKVNKVIKEVTERNAAELAPAFVGPLTEAAYKAKDLAATLVRIKELQAQPVQSQAVLPDMTILLQQTAQLPLNVNAFTQALTVAGQTPALEELNAQALQLPLNIQKATTSTKDLGLSVKELGTDIGSTFGSLSKQVLDTIVHAKNLSKAFTQVGKEIENALINGVIKALTQLIEKEIANALLSRAINSAIAKLEVAQMSGKAGAAAAASAFETLPFPLAVAVAPGYAAAAIGVTTAAGAPALASSAEGRDVGEDMVSMVHAGEVILSEGQTSKLGAAIDKGAAGNLAGNSKGGDTHIHINGATKSLMDEVWNYGVKQGRRAGVAW